MDRSSLPSSVIRWHDKYGVALVLDPYPPSSAADELRAVTSLGTNIHVVAGRWAGSAASRASQLRRDHCHAVCVDPDAAGTVTECLSCVRATDDNGLGLVIGATFPSVDGIAADIAVACNAGIILMGTGRTSAAVANRLLEICEEMGDVAASLFVGHRWRAPARHWFSRAGSSEWTQPGLDPLLPRESHMWTHAT